MDKSVSYSHSKRCFFVVLNKHVTDEEWCCMMFDRYPDMVPFVDWGSCSSCPSENSHDAAEYHLRNCDNVVGDANKSNCIKNKEGI